MRRMQRGRLATMVRASYRRDRISAHREQPPGLRDERGAVLVFTAFALIALLAIAAMAIDFGLLFNERRAAQAAIDNATMAAAFADCEGRDPQAAALAAIAANGYTAAEMTKMQAIGTRYEGEIRTTVDGAFLPALGIDNTEVSAGAVADCAVGTAAGEVNAAFWSWTWIKISGQDTRNITGGFFANGDGCSSIPCAGPVYNGSGRPNGYMIHNSGQAPQDIDEVSCTAPNCSGGSEPLHLGTPGGVLTVTGKAPSFPLPLKFDDYKPAGPKGATYWCAAGSSTDTSCDAGISSDGQPGTYNYVDMSGGTKSWSCPLPGVYVVDGNIRITGEECGKSSYRNVTLVASGWIDITGADAYLESYDKDRDGVVLFSDSAAAPYSPVSGVTSAIRLTGQDPHVWGLIAAPNGNFGEGGQDLRDSRGAVVAHSISSTGQDLRNYTFDDSFLSAGGAASVWLER